MRQCSLFILSLVPTGLLLLAIMAPVLGGPAQRVSGPHGGVDALMQAGILEWTGRHFWQPAVWIGLPIFYPVTGALTYMDSLLGQALAVLPLRLFPATTPGLIYNTAFLVSLMLAVAAMLSLWRASGGKVAFAGWGGLALLGSPYTTSQLGHLNQLPPAPALFALAALLVATERTRRQKPGAGLFMWLWAAAMVWQGAWGWYGTAHAAFASLTVLVIEGWRGRRIGLTRRLLLRLVGPILLAGMGIWALATPYIATGKKYSDFERSDGEIRYYSADLKHFLNPGAYRLEGKLRQKPPVTGTEATMGTSRTVLHPGWLALILAVVGWFGRRKLTPHQQTTGRIMIAVGLVGLVLAFGDSVGLPGSGRRLPLPLGILQDVIQPLRALRTVWRFSFLFTLAVAWWSAAGGQVLWHWRGRRGAGLAVGLLGLLLVESWPVAVPTVDIPVWGRQGSADPLAGLPAGAVLTLPAPPDEYAEDLTEATWLHRSLSHRHPVTGGVSGWVPPATRELRSRLAACAAGSLEFDTVWAELQAGGVRYIEIAESADADRGGTWRRVLAQHGLVVRPSVPGFIYHGPEFRGTESGMRATQGKELQ